MRIDKFLKVSRLIRRRTVANDACGNEHISVNGKVVKPSYDVKIGDIIEIAFGTRVLRVRVTDIKDSTKKADAGTMYEVVD
ncbi:MAG: RNA-binding S4 domain-containing protein [Clostridia bacterium]|nr:RNA-binding S4 domain-containing protein [Clostridia bacterium]